MNLHYKNLVFIYIYFRIHIYKRAIRKIEKNNFLLLNDQFFTKGVKVFRNHGF